MTEQELITFITDAYGGDLASPDYSFITTAMQQRPYDGTVEQIKALGPLKVREHTDITNYVAFSYVIDGDSQAWALELSMLGPFAVFARIGSGQWLRLLQPDDRDLEPVERQIFDILGQHRLAFPTHETLETPLEMTFDYTDPENARIYHALFSDEDFVPWEYSPYYSQRDAETRSESER